jgi:asparaginyl-tRNA synthetase
MLEPEMAFMDHEDCIRVEENLITSIVKRVLEHRHRELAALERDTTLLKKVEPPFPRISYTEAVEELQKAAVEDPKLQIEWGSDLGAPHERYISQKFEIPVVVHRYPAKAKAFYMEPDPENPEVALCNDLLAPEGYGEIIGASERISNYELLEKRLNEWGLPKEEHEWYLNLRRFGTIPHSGFGMGVERVVTWICKLEHIRETIPFPRTIARLYP